MKILITGGSGFLGSALALHLDRLGHHISLLLRPTSSLIRLGVGASSRFNIGRCVTDAEVGEFVSAVEPQAVIHTACSYGRNGEPPLAVHDANTRFGLSVLLAALAAHGARSSEKLLFLNTGTGLEANSNFYALTKHQFSQLGRALSVSNKEAFVFVEVALQHMFGPNDDASKFSSYVISACKSGQAKLALTAGQQRRDFIYIDDVLSAYECLLDSFTAPSSPSTELGYHYIPVGSGNAPTIRHFVETVRRISGSTIQLQFGAIPYRPEEAMLCQADLTVMTNLGWRPRFSLEDGLRKTIQMDISQ